MSRENVESLQRVYEAMARGQFWAAREVFDPDIVWEWSSSFSGLTGVATYRGLEGVETATRDWLGVWDWFWQEAVDFAEAGDSVVVFTRQHGLPKGGSKEIQTPGTEVWTFRAGRAIHFKAYDSPVEALESVGLSE